AERLCQRAIVSFQNTSDQIHLGTAFQNLAVVELAKGNAKKASIAIDSAPAILKSNLPSDHPFVVYALGTKLTICMKLERFEQGEQLIPQLLALSASRFGPSHPERVILLNNAAALYVAENRYSNALPLLRAAVAISERCFATGHPTRSSTLANYAYVLGKLNRKDEAARVLAESQVIRAGAPVNTFLPQSATDARGRTPAAFGNPR